MISRTQLLLFSVAAAAVAAIAGTTYGAFSSTTSNGGNSFQAASSFCTAIAPLWMTGIEHGFVSASGQFSAISNLGGPVAADSDARSGGYSLKITDGVLGASNAQITVSGSTVVVRFGLRLASLPEADVSLAYIAAGTDVVLKFDSAAHKLELVSGASTVAASSTVAAGDWYLIDLRARFSETNTADWQIDGVAQGQLSTSAGTATAVGFGSRAILESYTANYDDIIVSLSSGDYPVGSGRILRLGAHGTTHPVTEFRDHDNTDLDANSWDLIDDLPMVGVLDYIKQITAAGGSYVQVAFDNAGSTCIRAVFATVSYDNSTVTANNGKTSIFDGTTERIVYSGDMGVTALTYKLAFIPAASPPWTQAAVNALVGRIGYSTNVGSQPQWHALGLEYETDP